MRNIISLVLAFLIFGVIFIISFVTEPQPEVEDSNIVTYHDNKQNVDSIAVKASFVPMKELSEEDRKLSLEEFINKQLRKEIEKLDKEGKVIEKIVALSPYDEIQPEIRRLVGKGYSLGEATSEAIRLKSARRLGGSSKYKDNIKNIPITSALVKVYYLEDPESFKRNNTDYYNSIIGILNKELENERIEMQKKAEEDAQKQWEKYL